MQDGENIPNQCQREDFIDQMGHPVLSKGAFSLRISSTANLKKEAAAPPTPSSSSPGWRTKDERPIPPYPGQAAPMAAVEKQPEHPPQPSQQQPVKEPPRRDFGRDSRTPERCKPTSSSSSVAMVEFDAKKGVKLPILSPPKTAAGSHTIITRN